MRKSILLPILVGVMALSLWGCKEKGSDPSDTKTTAGAGADRTNDGTADTAADRIVISQEKEDPIGDPAGSGEGSALGDEAFDLDPSKGVSSAGGAAADAFSFVDLKGQEFIFSSGAGGWGTWMMVDADGSFSGTYSDSDMGSTGEGYPNGTMAWSEFCGQFTEPVQVDPYTYTTQIASIGYADTIGTEEIKEGLLYRYTDAYGLDGTKEIKIHLPGAPLETLSEEVRSWIGHYDLSAAADTTLSFYVLENAAQGYGFKGYDVLVGLREQITLTEEQAAILEASIQNDPLSQSELTEKTKEIYDLWDSALNEIWSVLKDTLDKEAMAALTVEEREWIARKEQAVADAGAEFAGGSMQPMIMNDKAAQMTKDRVYELLELLDR